MNYQLHSVATLVSAPGARLDSSVLDAAVNALREVGAVSVSHKWLAEGRAADVFFSSLESPNAYMALRAVLDVKKIDAIVQPVANRRKKLLLADMESTIIEQEMLDELAGMLGVGARVAEITRKAMNGELDFIAAIKERVGLLAGQPAALLEQAEKLITPVGGAAELVAAVKSGGGQCWLVSGGFACFANVVAERLGFARVFANKLIVENGKIIGEAAEPILDKNSKKATLDLGCNELGLRLSDCVTIGDGANDVPMLNACNDGGGLGVAYHAKPTVRAAVPHQINHGDLSALAFAL